MEKYKQIFGPLKSRPKLRRVVSFDCEGTGDAGFVCGSVYHDERDFFFTDRQAMRDYLFSSYTRGSLIVAHNLEYDLAMVCNGDFHDLKMLYLDTRLIRVVKGDDAKHSWRLIDSRNLFPSLSVADLGKLLDLPKLSVSRDVMTLFQRGVSFAAMDMFTQQQVRAYNVRDSEIVWRAVMWLQELLHELGGELQDTIAGCAMDLYRRRYLSCSWATPPMAVNDFARSAYYGARTEPYQVGEVKGVNYYDANSLYPSVQATIQFPHPDYFDIEHGSRALRAIESREGIMACQVFVPDMHVPPLPVRVNGRLFFPMGLLSGVWPLNEIRYALTQGASITRVDWVFSSGRTFNPFADFMNDLFSRRLDYKRDGNRAEQVVKLLLNSSYGRYGVRTRGGLQVLAAYDPDKDYSAYAGGEIRVYNNTAYVLLPIGEDSQPQYAATMLAAYIASGARVRLHQQLLLAGQSLVYTDTDSVMSTCRLPTGDGLGDMRLEYGDVDAQVVGPKEYRLDRNGYDPLFHIKGVPEDKRREYMSTGHVDFLSPMTIREALWRGDVAGRWVYRSRTRAQVPPKREIVPPLPESPGCCPTRPWDVADLRGETCQPLWSRVGQGFH